LVVWQPCRRSLQVKHVVDHGRRHLPAPLAALYPHQVEGIRFLMGGMGKRCWPTDMGLGQDAPSHRCDDRGSARGHRPSSSARPRLSSTGGGRSASSIPEARVEVIGAKDGKAENPRWGHRQLRTLLRKEARTAP